MNPLISVIIPVYNAEKYLNRCVDSVIHQTHGNLEIVLVDDGSSDGSSKICDDYAAADPRIKVIHKKNGGVCSARNVGLDACTGDYVGFLDSDDWLALTTYEKLLTLCYDSGIIATIGATLVNESGKTSPIRIFEDKQISQKEFVFNILCRKDGCSVCSRLFPRQVIGNSRFPENKLNEEILFWISVMDRIQGVGYISDIGYYRFHNEGSLSRCFGKSVHDMIRNAKEAEKYVKKAFPSLSREVKQFVLYQHMNFLLACPSDYDRKNDPMYGEVLAYARKHIFFGLRTPHFTKREKINLLSVSFFPRFISRVRENKRKRIK